jgi:CelD/BcsL family acetyltransferase involved in cellulose biosynthesis
MNALAHVNVPVADSAAQLLRVNFVTDLAGLTSLKDRWENLNRRVNDHESPFFQSYAWCAHVATIRLAQSPSRFRLFIATVWRNDCLIGLWPLSMQKMLGAWIVKNLDDPFGQFAGVVFEHKTDIEPGVIAVVENLKTNRLADGLRIDAVVEQTPLHTALKRTDAVSKFVNEAVYVDLRPYDSFAGYAETVNKKTRRNLRNALHRLKRRTWIESLVLDDKIRVGEIIATTFAGRLEWMHEYGHSSPAFRDRDFRHLLESLSECEEIDLIGFSLASSDESIATQWGFTYLGRYYAYLSAKNFHFDEFSPGRLHFGMVIEACKARNIDVLELMPPASGYKLSLSEHTKKLDAFSTPFNVKGYLALNLFADKLIPATRSVSHRLPESVRKRLVGYVNSNR